MHEIDEWKINSLRVRKMVGVFEIVNNIVHVTTLSISFFILLFNASAHWQKAKNESEMSELVIQC